MSYNYDGPVPKCESCFSNEIAEDNDKNFLWKTREGNEADLDEDVFRFKTHSLIAKLFLGEALAVYITPAMPCARTRALN